MTLPFHNYVFIMDSAFSHHHLVIIVVGMSVGKFYLYIDSESSNIFLPFILSLFPSLPITEGKICLLCDSTFECSASFFSSIHVHQYRICARGYVTNLRYNVSHIIISPFSSSVEQHWIKLVSTQCIYV